jgi:hypothetical protein
MNRSLLIRWTAAVAMSSSFLACGTNAVSSGESGALEIQTETSVASSVINSGGAGLEATLRNTTSQTFYANVGDAFNSAEEQDPLITTSGSDAVVEGKNSYDVWAPLDQGVMIEGTKYVVIKPGKTYRLTSLINAPSFRGQARIRVRYSTTPNGTGTIAVDYSNVFEIR